MPAGNGNGNGANAKAAGGGKPPMLLLHGFTGTPVMWDPIRPYLEFHHDIVALNLPGHFGGPTFSDPGNNVADAMVDAIELQMDELGWDRAHIVGNSLGGWLSLLLADRKRALSTVAISPAGGWGLNSAEVRRVVKLFKRVQKEVDWFYPLAIELAKRPRGRQLALFEAMAYPARLPGPLAVQWIEAIANTPAWELMLKYSPYVNAPSTMDGLDSPVRIAWGTKDRILPFAGTAAGWKAALPDAEWIMLEGLGHVPMSDDPALVARTILELSTAHQSEVVEPEPESE